ncbi:MAG: arsenite S-adenosylmethyltransferase, partial [Proteobacteria bacterium]|nr:arsenite S-adenosylmethyltransferase [Pseudomonadota bacterium]
MDKNRAKKAVKEAYGKIVQGKSSCGCGTSVPDKREFAKSIGYSEIELKVIPDEANLALSCGNPTALANLKEGDIV